MNNPVPDGVPEGKILRFPPRRINIAPNELVCSSFPAELPYHVVATKSVVRAPCGCPNMQQRAGSGKGSMTPGKLKSLQHGYVGPGDPGCHRCCSHG